MYRNLEFAVFSKFRNSTQATDYSVCIEQQIDRFEDKQANIQTVVTSRTYDSIVYPGRVASVAK